MEIHLRSELQNKLAALAAEQGRDPNDILAEALDRTAMETGLLLMEKESLQPSAEGLEQYFGLWARNGHPEDGLAYQKRMRSEW